MRAGAGEEEVVVAVAGVEARTRAGVGTRTGVGVGEGTEAGPREGTGAALHRSPLQRQPTYRRRRRLLSPRHCDG